jgi:glycerol-3-phosphate acyltransferase PlsY
VIAALGILAAYLLGSIPTGYVVARAFGVSDLRRHGSGNIGTTNVLRTAGRVPAVLTLLGDVGKGYAAVLIAGLAGGGDPWITAAGAVAVVVGNCWSVLLGFRGGKGGATGLGALLRLALWATWPAALVWIAIALAFRYASLATLTAAICIPLGAALLGYGLPVFVAAAVGASIVILRHRENIARLLAGTENRLGQKKRPA